MQRVLADARIFRKPCAVRTNNATANTTDKNTRRKRSPSQARTETLSVSSRQDISAEIKATGPFEKHELEGRPQKLTGSRLPAAIAAAGARTVREQPQQQQRPERVQWQPQRQCGDRSAYKSNRRCSNGGRSACESDCSGSGDRSAYESNSSSSDGRSACEGESRTPTRE